MRHRVYGKHLGRDKDERRILFKGLVSSLILFGSIKTSETKAKAIKGLIDKVVNLAKNNKENELSSYLPEESLRERLTKEIAPNLGTRTSGYTSIVRMGTRLGDQATIVKMSIIGTEQLKPFKKEPEGRKEPKVEKTVSAKKGDKKV